MSQILQIRLNYITQMTEMSAESDPMSQSHFAGLWIKYDG
jgi:hypothetical protein